MGTSQAVAPEPGRFHGCRAVVLGLGLSGRAAARWLARGGARVHCTDARPVEEWPREFVAWCRAAGVEVRGGGHEADRFAAADLVVVSPGVPPRLPALQAAKRAGVPVVGELALAADAWEGPILAVTGTNGKTTTTEIAGAMLRAGGVAGVVAGNIGVPLADLLCEGEGRGTAVVEVSSFQLDTCPDRPVPVGAGAPLRPFSPHAGAWLNLAPDHLDRYPGMEAYGASKARLLRLQGETDWAVLNRGDVFLAPWAGTGRGRRLFFGFGAEDIPGAWADADGAACRVLWPDGREERYDLAGWTLKGRHNLENLMAAVLLARVAGAPPEAVQEVIPLFRAPAHRMQWVGRRDGVDYFDDSKATNVAAVVRALEFFGSGVVLVAGGQGKGEDYRPLAEAARGRLRGAVVMGEDQDALARELRRVTQVVTVPYIPGGEPDDGFRAMRRAVRAAAEMARPGDTVLLGPACASFDLFENYAARGRAFQEAVRRLGEGDGGEA
nr:UDP-N-acetylmuramoyl-L-alanine--D-glutamate ligase [Dissulfurirhabdus thermomarina]